MVARSYGTRRFVKRKPYNRFPRYRRRTLSGNVVRTKLTTTVKSITVTGSSSGTTFQGSAISVGLNAFPEHTTYTTMFDRYKINSAKIKWWWSNTQNPVVTGDTSTVDTQKTARIPFWSAVDYDDSTVPNDQDTIIAYRNVKLNLANSGSIAFKPGVPYAVGSTTSGVQWGKWIDMAFVNIGANGLKLGFVVPTNAITRSFNYVIEGDYTFAGRR